MTTDYAECHRCVHRGKGRQNYCSELGHTVDNRDVAERGCSWFSPGGQPDKIPDTSKSSAGAETRQVSIQGLTRLYAIHPIMVAKKIREAIGEKCLSQKEAAKQLGVSAQYLNDILKARRGVSAEIAVKLHCFGIGGLELYLGQEIHHYLCAAYHTEESGDPIGKHHFEGEVTDKMQPNGTVDNAERPVADRSAPGVT
jgi:plasmid maintenance system antidote protein VapI